MCTYEGQFVQAKKIICELLTKDSDTVQGIKAYLHADALMSQDHARVQEIFFRAITEMVQSGKVKADSTLLTETTMISLVH